MITDSVYRLKTQMDQDRACRGELCLKCRSENVECAGANPDGFKMNYAYNCKDCGNKWEGF